MVSDSATIKLLNLVRTNPSFVLKVQDDGSANLLSPKAIPKCTGMYWVAGTTVLPQGQRISSVFVVDSDSCAEQCCVFWYHDGDYFEHQESEELSRLLGLEVGAMFPYSWSYHVPVDGDAFAGSGGSI